MSGATWRCGECDTYNESGLRSCSVCGSVKTTRPAAEPDKKAAKKPTPRTRTAASRKRTPPPRRSTESPSTRSSWALGKVGSDWRCSACGAHNTSDDFTCASCGRVISVDDLLAILRESGETGPSRPSRSPSPAPYPPPSFIARRSSTATPRPTPRPGPSTTAPTAVRRPRTAGDIVLGTIGVVIILALVALLVLGTIALVDFLSEPTNAADPASGAAPHWSNPLTGAMVWTTFVP